MRLVKYFAYTIGIVAVSSAPSPNPAPLPLPQTTAAYTSNVNDVVYAVGVIVNQLYNLETKVLNFNGGILDIGQLLDIQVQSVKLGQNINDATDLIYQNEYAYSQEDSLTISAAVLNLLPYINGTLNAIIDKKDIFDHSVLELVSVSWLVNIDIKNLHQYTDDLAAALQSYLDPILNEAFVQVVQQIDGWFADAERVYADSGLFCCINENLSGSDVKDAQGVS